MLDDLFSLAEEILFPTIESDDAWERVMGHHLGGPFSSLIEVLDSKDKLSEKEMKIYWSIKTGYLLYETVRDAEELPIRAMTVGNQADVIDRRLSQYHGLLKPYFTMHAKRLRSF